MNYKSPVQGGMNCVEALGQDMAHCVGETARQPEEDTGKAGAREETDV